MMDEAIKVYTDIVNEYFPGLTVVPPYKEPNGDVSLEWIHKQFRVGIVLVTPKSEEEKREGGLKDSGWYLVSHPDIGFINMLGTLNIDNFREVMEWAATFPNLPEDFKRSIS
jgi:hypothetical protein